MKALRKFIFFKNIKCKVIGFKVLIDDNIQCFEFEQDEFNVQIDYER